VWRRGTLAACIPADWQGSNKPHSVGLDANGDLSQSWDHFWRANHHPHWVRSCLAFEKNRRTANVRLRGRDPREDQQQKKISGPPHRRTLAIQLPNQSPRRAEISASNKAIPRPLAVTGGSECGLDSLQKRRRHSPRLSV